MAVTDPIDVASAGLIWRDRILLVKRGQDPSKGLYAFPGGRLEPGESAEDAARREVGEETGLTCGPLDHLETIDLGGDVEPGKNAYRLHVFHGAHQGGDPVASDDADDAGWFSLREMETMQMTESSLRLARKLLADIG